MGSKREGAFVPDEPTLEWLTQRAPDAPDRNMRLVDASFKYTDPKGKPWEVKGGDSILIVNGASIPSFLWSTVGSPYTGNYRRASILHDFWCKIEGGRLEADRMFHSACLDGGCSPMQAWLLYVGVRIGAYLPFMVSWVGSVDAYPTFDYERPSQPLLTDISLLNTFTTSATLAKNKDFPEYDDDLANMIDLNIDAELRKHNLLPAGFVLPV